MVITVYSWGLQVFIAAIIAPVQNDAWSAQAQLKDTLRFVCLEEG